HRAFNELHDRPLEIVRLPASRPQIPDIVFELADVDNRIAFASVIISAEPNSDRIRFRQYAELLARNLRDIDGDFSMRARGHEKKEDSNRVAELTDPGRKPRFF